MAAKREYKAAAWRGAISAARFVKAAIPAIEREYGVTDVRDYYAEPLGNCAVCGAPIWHHWLFETVDGGRLTVGQECAEVVLGKSPAEYLADERERAAAVEAFAREAAVEAGIRSWWRAPQQAALRRELVLGYREERRHGASDFFRRALKAAKRGALRDGFRQWVERVVADGGAVEAARRTARALPVLDKLFMARLSRFDVNVVADLWEREFPCHDDRKVWGAPLSTRQCAMIEKLGRRYRKQIGASA